jgi:predicted DCC family thiol-disulfide oxidoreductase YuxK
MPAPSRYYILFYDGTCGLCRLSATFAQHRARRPLWLINAAHPWLLARFPEINPQQAMKSVHLLTPSGRIYRGFDAVVALSRILPFIRWFSPLLNTAPAQKLGWTFYEFVTRHRHQISRLLCLA